MPAVFAGLTGRLGNQLFVLCHAAVVAKTLRRDLHLYAVQDDEAKIITQNLASALQSLQLQTYTYATRITREIRSATGVQDEAPGGALAYVPVVDTPSSGKPILITGYRQHYMYFVQHWDWLSDKVFRLQACRDAVMDELKLEPLTRQIAVHVRRGDYASNTQNYSVLPVLGDLYYVRAVKEVMQRTGFTDVVVFCEPCDTDDVRATFVPMLLSQTGCKTAVLAADDGVRRTAWQEMLYMSTASAFVIANSTFSWWAAWMSAAHDKVVAMPDEWLGPAHPTSMVVNMAVPKVPGRGTWFAAPVAEKLTPVVVGTTSKLGSDPSWILHNVKTIADAFVLDTSVNTVPAGKELARDFTFLCDDSRTHSDMWMFSGTCTTPTKQVRQFVWPRLAVVDVTAQPLAVASFIVCIHKTLYAAANNCENTKWIAVRKGAGVAHSQLLADLLLLLQPERFGIVGGANVVRKRMTRDVFYIRRSAVLQQPRLSLADWEVQGALFLN